MEEQIFSIKHNGSQYEVAATYRQRSAEMILLLHGLGCSKASFRDIWSRDEFTDYSILSLDLLGFGESSKPMNFSYKMEDHACVCAQVVKNVISEKIHIVAHSMGGAIGLLMPKPVLDSVRTFVNLEGNLSREDCGIFSRKTIRVKFSKFERDILPEFRQLSRSFGPGRFFLDSALPMGFYRSAESLVKWSDSGNLMERFRNLTCRKAYFYGEKNVDAVALHRLESIEKIPIADSGHFMMNDNPDEFYRRLGKFIKSV